MEMCVCVNVACGVKSSEFVNETGKVLVVML